MWQYYVILHSAYVILLAKFWYLPNNERSTKWTLGAVRIALTVTAMVDVTTSQTTF